MLRPLRYVWLFCLLLATAEISSAAKPNLILIMADDLGYETIGANGSTSYQTPTLDGLASGGARFTHCYVQPLCTPTRCQVMTGRYNVRNYTEFGQLIRSEITFANLLQQAGYKTCIVGKWQLGKELDSPQHFGFEESCLWQHTRRPARYANPGLEINGQSHDYAHGEYGPDLVTDFAIDFITRHRSEPFLLYYPMILTHAPYPPTPDSADWNPHATRDKQGNNRRHFGDMVEYMDKLIGRIVSHLEELNLRDNTLLIFVGDNGTGRGIKSKLGEITVTGGKGNTTAAGMHVPLIVNWPGHVKQQVCKELVDSTDFLPTLLEVAEVTPPTTLELDGVSFYSQILGRPGDVRRFIYSWYCPRPNNDPAVREFVFNQKYKLYHSGEFFELDADPLEQKPLQSSELSGEMKEQALAFQKQLEKYRDIQTPAFAKLE